MLEMERNTMESEREILTRKSQSHQYSGERTRTIA